MKPGSMEEKIGYRLFLMGFAGLVCTAALCIFVFHKAFRAQAWTALENEASLEPPGTRRPRTPPRCAAMLRAISASPSLTRMAMC